MLASPAEVVGLRHHPDFGQAVPTAEHFLPLLYLAGLAEAAGSAADVLVDGYAYGSLSMAAYTLDASRPERTTSPSAAAPIPSSDLVPPDDTNA
jgi:4,5-DOPA dioxygenase extradiol